MRLFSGKVKKGEYGFLPYQKNRVMVFTILYFAISISIYLIGYATTGSNRNLLTIVAVLGLLPSCKSLVNLIMLFRAKACSQDVYDKIGPHEKELAGVYDLYFTTYKVNYPVSHMVLKDHVLVGYCEYSDCDVRGCEEHLKEMLKQDGHKNTVVKIFRELDRYLERLDQLSQTPREELTEDEIGILTMLLSISLS